MDAITCKMASNQGRIWRVSLVCLFAPVVACAAGTGLPRLDSAQFDFKYEMEVLPSAEDLDGDGTFDFTQTVTGGASMNAVYGLVVFDGRNGNCYINSEAGGAWRNSGIDSETGYTIEVRMMVRHHISGANAICLTGGISDSSGSPANSALNFSTNEVKWGESTVLTNLDLSVAMHTFRIVRLPGEERYHVWCDGRLLAKNLDGAYQSWGVQNRIVFGAIGGQWRGDSFLSYLRFTKGAFEPAPAEMRRATDFETKYEMGEEDDRFSADSSTDDWTMTGDSGSASLADGILSVRGWTGVIRYWKSKPMSSSAIGAIPFTLEFGLRVSGSYDTSGNGRVLYLSCGTAREYAYFIIGTNDVRYVVRSGNSSFEKVICEGDNADAMHVFRITFCGDGDGAAAGFSLWRDGKLVSDCITAYQTDNGSNGVVFGLGSRAYGGAFEVDYVRWTTEGAYVPYVPPKGFAISFK